MKTKILTLLLAVTALLFHGCSTVPKTAGAPAAPAARIAAINGGVEVLHNGAWKPVSAGATLRQGDAIKTAAGSSADLNFGEYGGTAKVTPGSEVWIEQFGWVNEPAGQVMQVLLDLRAGRITGDTLNPAPNSRFMVRTAGGTFELK